MKEVAKALMNTIYSDFFFSLFQMKLDFVT